MGTLSTDLFCYIMSKIPNANYYKCVCKKWKKVLKLSTFKRLWKDNFIIEYKGRLLFNAGKKREFNYCDTTKEYEQISLIPYSGIFSFNFYDLVNDPGGCRLSNIFLYKNGAQIVNYEIREDGWCTCSYIKLGTCVWVSNGNKIQKKWRFSKNIFHKNSIENNTRAEVIAPRYKFLKVKFFYFVVKKQKWTRYRFKDDVLYKIRPKKHISYIEKIEDPNIEIHDWGCLLEFVNTIKFFLGRLDLEIGGHYIDLSKSDLYKVNESIIWNQLC